MKPDTVTQASLVAATALLPPPCAASDPAAIRQRIEWLFRGAAPTEPIQQLREIVQRYRLEVRS